MARVGIVFHGDLSARNNTDLSASRFAGITSALSANGLEPVPAVFNDDFVGEFVNDASNLDALLVWVNPITADGHDRSKLDEALRDLAKNGVLVSTHPDIILRMGTKQVLFDTKGMGWGSDVRVYNSLRELETGIKNSLADGRARVLKQYRGHSGGGIWKVQRDGDMFKLRHAERGSIEQKVDFEKVLETFAPYFQNGGRMIDQEYQERLTDGMIRCYLVVDKIEGFGHQAINALFPAPPGANPEDAPQPGPRLYYPPDKPEFQQLRRKMEDEFLPELLTTLKLNRAELPLLWDADFLFGPKDKDGDDTYVLCEINVSSVSPFPEWAEAPLARATLQRLMKTS